MKRQFAPMILAVALVLVSGLVLAGCDEKPAAASEQINTMVDGPSTLEKTESQTKKEKATAGDDMVAATEHDCPACQEGDCRHCDGAAKRGFHYSPFVLRVEDEHFRTISFKDVGLQRETTDPDDPLFEVLAESLRYELLANESLRLESQVEYDRGILDPANHAACGQKHLYVDVWRAPHKRWGYSLWSGCGEDDNFAWHEVHSEISPASPLADQVTPLTRSIVDSIRAAKSSGCFQKNC